jgi:hypothetical protein
VSRPALKAASSSETVADFLQNTRHYIPEDRLLHNHRCENLNSYRVAIPLYSLHLKKGRDPLSKRDGFNMNHTWMMDEVQKIILYVETASTPPYDLMA